VVFLVLSVVFGRGVWVDQFLELVVVYDIEVDQLHEEGVVELRELELDLVDCEPERVVRIAIDRAIPFQREIKGLRQGIVLTHDLNPCHGDVELVQPHLVIVRSLRPFVSVGDCYFPQITDELVWVVWTRREVDQRSVDLHSYVGKSQRELFSTVFCKVEF
jgi:hypothetical protein